MEASMNTNHDCGRIVVTGSRCHRDAPPRQHHAVLEVEP
jgi:hypothetical protein